MAGSISRIGKYTHSRVYSRQLRDIRLRSEIMRLSYADEIATARWSMVGRMKTARFGALALPLVNQFVLLGGKSNATNGKDKRYY